MLNTCLIFRRACQGIALALWVLAASNAAATTAFETKCTGCHSPLPSVPPKLLSQDAGRGKILPNPDDGRLQDTCLNSTAIFNCGLRQKLRGEDASGNIINQTARNNMLGLGDGLSNEDLESIRLYLIQVRDAEVSTPTPSFTPTVIGSSSTTSFSFTISNFRGLPIQYSTGLAGGDAGDFAILSQSASGCSPDDTVLATATVSASVCSVTVQAQFQPQPGPEGSRTTQFQVTLSPSSSADPVPLSVNITLSAQALPVPTPVFSISSTTIPFAATVNIPSIGNAVITNTGTAALTLSSLTFDGLFKSDYSLAASNTCAAATSLQPNSDCTLAIQFAPSAAGDHHDATLSIAHNAAGSPAVVTLLGTATAKPQGQIALSAFSLDFPDTQKGSDAAQSIMVQNTGTAALTFSAFTITGAAAADYARSGSCSTSVPLPVAQRCEVIVTFKPTALGLRNASLTIQSDASNGPAAITLSGTGVSAPAPQVNLSPTALDFGAQTVGGLYPNRSIRLVNSGTADLSVSGIVVTGGVFADASTTACPATLAPGASCLVEIRFTPAAADTDYPGTLQVTSNAAGSPHAVPLHGRGTAEAVPVLLWSNTVSNPLDFGLVAAGTISATTKLRLLNQGPGGVTLTLLNAVGVDASAFSVTTGTCSIVTPMFEGSTCDIEVRFAPASAGVKTASVQIISTGSSPPPWAVTGTGLSGPGADLVLSATALSFELTRVGAQSAPQEITLASNGSGAVQVTGMALDGPYTMQTKTCPNPPFMLQAGSSCTVSVMFQPQAEGDATGLLRVSTDASSAPHEVALRGEGEPKADLSSGGCSLSAGNSIADPTLWTLLALALAALLYRHRARSAQRRREARIRRERP